MSLIQRECHTATHNGKSPNSTKSVGGANGGVISATSLATPGSNGSSVGANGANGTHGANGANGPVTPQVQISQVDAKISQVDAKGVNSARSTDLIFLKSVVSSNTEAQHNKPPPGAEPDDCLPITHDSLRLVDQVKTIAEQRIYLDEANELYTLLTAKWIQALLEVHDEVAAHIQNSLEEVKYIDGVSSNEESEEEDVEEKELDDKAEKSDSSEEIVDTFRVIGLRRKAGESLGLTVTTDEGGKVIVARIIINSFIERQGLLRPGDLILEANGERVKNPEQLQSLIEDSVEFITLKIQPTLSVSQSQPSNIKEKTVTTQQNKYYVRCLFSYDPTKDSLLPCTEIGLPFRYGDILQVVNGGDPSWWQARHEAGDTIGLIPSQDLEERRKCFVDKQDISSISKWSSCCGSGKKEKKRFPYHFRKNAEVDTADLQLYEPVERMPPFTRKTLVLVGPKGVGRKALISRIVQHDNKLFETTKAVTSRPLSTYEVDGENCWFISHEEILAGIDRDEFLEVRDEDSFLSGTTYQSIRTVISQSKLCLIDCNPEALKILHHSPEFLPFVIFLSAPSMAVMRNMAMQGKENGHNFLSSDEDIRNALEESNRIREEFQKYFDLEIVVEDFDKTFRTIMESLEKLTNESQWVPLNWVYS